MLYAYCNEIRFEKGFDVKNWTVTAAENRIIQKLHTTKINFFKNV